MLRPKLPVTLRAITPVTVAFFGSLLLSLIALAGSALNRDGMQYVTTAQAFLDGGFAAARSGFSWPFLSVFMALLSTVSGLSLESSGHLMNAVFMSSSCALMVACVKRLRPEIAWSACMVVLALPGLNEYRNELLREYGCWFFVMLGFWLALRWQDRPVWHLALLAQAALGVAMLFRPEAVAFFPVLIVWQLSAAPRAERWSRVAQYCLVPAIGAALLSGLYLSGELDHGNRLVSDMRRLNVDQFNTKAQALAASLIEYARGQAGTILFFGSLALIPIKLIQKMGLFLIPLAFLLASGNTRQMATRFSLFAWAIVAHLLVLSVFVTDLQFLAGRYVGPSLLFSVPFVACGLDQMLTRFSRLRWGIVVLVVLAMFANVVSTGPGKTHFIEAGDWLAAHADQSPRIYIDSGRTAFYAKWKSPVLQNRADRTAVERAVHSGLYDLFVFELSHKDAPRDEAWFEDNGLQVVKRFEVSNGDAVIIASPVTNSSHAGSAR